MAYFENFRCSLFPYACQGAGVKWYCVAEPLLQGARGIVQRLGIPVNTYALIS